MSQLEPRGTALKDRDRLAEQRQPASDPAGDGPVGYPKQVADLGLRR